MPAASMVAELTEIDSLPGTKIQPAPGYRYVNARSRDNTLGMSGHIIPLSHSQQFHFKDKSRATGDTGL